MGGRIFPPRQRYPHQQPVKRSRGGWGGTKTDACPATSVFPSADIASPIPPLHPTTDGLRSVVMAQNRFSIFCRRKTTEEEEGRGSLPRRHWLHRPPPLYCHRGEGRGETGMAGRYVAIGGKGKRGRFLEASGSNDGKYPISWQTDSTHSGGLLGGLSRGRKRNCHKGFGNESFSASRGAERVSNLVGTRSSHSLPSPHLPSSGPGWEMVGDSLHSSSSREIRLSWSWISSQICSAERKEEKECLSSEERKEGRKEADSKSNFIPSPLFFTLSPPHRVVTCDAFIT